MNSKSNINETLKRLQELEQEFGQPLNLSNFASVREMYKKYGWLKNWPGPPQMLDKNTTAFRLFALQEELNELAKGYANENLPEVADALVDLVIFALGTAALHNLPWKQLFEEVMRANNQKEIGQGSKLRSNGTPDLIKPLGWRGPRIKEILKKFGWKP